MNQEGAHSLVPPRPNPGPEPWTEARPATTLVVAAGLLLTGLLLLLRTRIRRRSAEQARAYAPPAPRDDTPAGKLLKLADAVRGTLITRFGPAMRARTTEEIAADSAVRDILGPSHLDYLVSLFTEADRWKFATEPGNGHDERLLKALPDWHAWYRALVKDLAAKPRSRAVPGQTPDAAQAAAVLEPPGRTLA